MPSCYTTQGAVVGCSDAIGGVSEIYIADFIDKGTPTISGSGVITAWTDAIGDFYTYQIKPETANFTQTPTRNEASGTLYYEQAGVFQLSGLDSNRELENDILNKGRVIVIFKSRGTTPKYFVIGLENGATITTPAETGTAMGDFKGYKLNVSAKEEVYWREVSASVVAAIKV
jgi:hypothetical protein